MFRPWPDIDFVTFFNKKNYESGTTVRFSDVNALDE